MAYLGEVQNFCMKWGLPVPGALVGVTDATFRQLHALSREAIEDLAGEPWQFLNLRMTALTVAAEDQGKLEDVFNSHEFAGALKEYSSLHRNTLWDVDGQYPFIGPLSPVEWQAVKTSAASGASYYFTIQRDRLLLWPVPPANRNIAAIVKTKNMILDSGGAVKENLTADDDTFRFAPRVFRAHLEWRFLKQKGEEWESVRRDADAITTDELNTHQALPTLHLDDAGAARKRPGVWIPAGNW